MNKLAAPDILMLLLAALASNTEQDRDASAAVAVPVTAAADDAVPELQGLGSAAQPPIQLPLRKGYYVTRETACGDASNATTLLVRRDGIAGSRDFCAFAAIKQTGPETFLVEEHCGELNASTPAATQNVTYTITDDTSFVAKREDGQQLSARYCDQAELPPLFRDNDIRDI